MARLYIFVEKGLGTRDYNRDTELLAMRYV
ncbi:hypothetical protein NUACC26_099080 [Scytonema sp. NUACC26]